MSVLNRILAFFFPKQKADELDLWLLEPFDFRMDWFPSVDDSFVDKKGRFCPLKTSVSPRVTQPRHLGWPDTDSG